MSADPCLSAKNAVRNISTFFLFVRNMSTGFEG
jgi:hypothetical protein